MSDGLNGYPEAAQEPAADGSPFSGETKASKRRLRLWLLFTGHVILGLVFCIWSAAEGTLSSALASASYVVVLALTSMQTSLLGFWAAFSTVRWWIRLAVLIVGAAYLEFLCVIGTHSEGIICLAVLAAGGMAAASGLVRWLGFDLHQFSQQAPPTSQEGWKFSIWGLMLFTLLISIAIVGIRELREIAPTGSNLFGAFAWSTCFVLVGLAGVWAVMGAARPVMRSIGVLLGSSTLGMIFVYVFDETDVIVYLFVSTTLLLQAAMLIASLLVVRSSGYRLVRKSATCDTSPT